MALPLKDIEKAHKILKEYDGDNSYIIDLKNSVFAYKTLSLNDFHVDFILNNYDKEPKFINKIVKIIDWYGEKLKNKYNLEFTPKVLLIGYYMGSTTNNYVFYAKYRQSQDKAVLLFPSKNAILTDFLTPDFHDLDLDFTEIEKKCGKTLYEHQKEAVKFLLARKKAILNLEMGLGKTITSIVASILGNYKHILVVCPSSVKKTWYDELKLFENEENITVVQGSEWKDAKYTVINYDILDNFYVIPKQKIKVSELNVDNEGNVFKETKEKEIVSRSKKIIGEAMANSQLFLAKYDLIIIDEAHRLSNSTSGRFKIMQDLIKRSNPDGIFELTGTLITNSVSNLYNLLKLIGVPITKDWQHYMERYAGCKFFYKKNERAAYTAMFCKGVGKSDWASLSYDEKKRLDEWLEKRCKKIMIPSGENTNLEELQEIIKPYYYKRDKEELKNMATKTVKILHYEMDDEEKESYNNLWESYLALQEDKEKTEANKKLIEVSLMRQWLADKMISRTISLVRKCIEAGHKVVIFCAYDNEINKFVEEFNNECVYHNGKLNEKKKAEAVEKFQNDESIKVFVGNITSAGVGLTLIAASVAVFNNFSFVPSDNHQCEDRIVRIGQTKPCTIYYQSFDGTYFDDMLKIVNDKQEVIDKVIKKEAEK